MTAVEHDADVIPEVDRGARHPTTRPPMRKQRTGSVLPLALVAPAIVLLVLFTAAPAIYAFWLSFFQQRVGGGVLGTIGAGSEVFAGLTNYAVVLGDPVFWASIGRMLLIVGISVPATIVLATIFALCLDAQRARLVGISRLAIFLPFAVPGVIASLLWGFLYLPATSPIGGDVIDYLGGTGVFFAVANILIWGAVGFNMVVLYTAIRALPAELYDAAQLDGASELQIALRIKLPLIRPAIVMVALFLVLGALQIFNEPTTLRPLTNAITTTWVPLMIAYDKAFIQNNIYQGAATAFTLLVLVVGATVLVTWLTRGIGRAGVKRG